MSQDGFPIGTSRRRTRRPGKVTTVSTPWNSERADAVIEAGVSTVGEVDWVGPQAHMIGSAHAGRRPHSPRPTARASPSDVTGRLNILQTRMFPMHLFGELFVSSSSPPGIVSASHPMAQSEPKRPNVLYKTAVRPSRCLSEILCAPSTHNSL